MHCPFCTFEESKVIDSRLVTEGSEIRRRRECLKCGERWTTFEVGELVMPKIIKQDKKKFATSIPPENRMNEIFLFRRFIYRLTNKILKISKKDAFKQYLAYHEGWGNYKYYKKNKKVIGLAKKVEKQSNIYKKQLLSCSNSLNKNKYIIF